MPSPKRKSSADSVGAHLAHLMRIGLRLIPLDAGAKTTHEQGWSDAGEATLAGFAERAGRLWRHAHVDEMLAVPLAAWVDSLPATGFNIGCLHKQSGTVCLDLDHPMALQALQAGVEAAGGPAGYLPTSDASWTSVRGRKWLWRAPRDIAGRSVRLNARRRRPDGKVTSEVVLELRGAGQDMIPPGYRADAERVLSWDAAPGSIGAAPAPIVRLVKALLGDDTAVVHAMQLAVGVTPDLLGMDATHVDDYPSRLAAAVHERMLVNTNVDVAELLSAHGFVQRGRRWGEPGSTHADGITMPAGNREHWHCWHESSVLAGQFDAWRAYVELSHAGNLAQAKDAARSQFKVRVGLVEVPPTANSTGQTRTILTAVPHDEKMVQDSTIPPDEMPRKAPKRASKRSAPPQATTVPAEGQEAILEGLPGKGSKRAQERADGGSGRAVAPSRQRGHGGAFSQAGGLPDGPLVVGADGLSVPAPEPEASAIGGGESIAAPAPGGRLSIRELLARKKVPPRLVLTGQLRVPIGTYILAGAPKAGKSWLAMAQSLVLSGWMDEVMGMRAVQPADGIYILTDDATVDRVQERIELLRSDGHDREGAQWDVFTSWPEAGSPYDGMSRIDALDAYLADHPGCRHVTIDTLVSWRESDRDNAVVQQEYTEVRNLQEVARRHGALLTIVHYVNKGGSAKNFDWDDPFVSIAGTTALQGGADGMMLLHRVASHDGAQHGALWFRCRDLEEQEAAGELTKPSGRWSWLAASADAIKTMDVRRAVVEWLLAQPAEAHHEAKVILDGVAGTIDISPKLDSFKRTLNRMKHEGLVDGKRGNPGGGFRLHPAHRAELVGKRRF